MSDLHRKIVIETFATEDDAVRAIQGLRAAGFDTDDITLAGRNHDDARRVAETLDVETTDEWPDNGRETDLSDQYRIVVNAGDNAAFARRVMIDGLVDATGFMYETDESVYLDSSTGSGAGVAASTGTATGITPGSGYEGNTGSTAATTSGPLGQFTPSADTPDDEDDFPG
ncbi:MAG TPA: general stress protein [Thermomicrobiales bacterium]|nr:general stress protein [Thermomicrobiales bacterium]